MTTARETLHRLVDELPEREIATAARFLDYLRATTRDLPRALAEAPEDDEPTTPEEDAAAAEGRADYQRGAYMSSEEARAAIAHEVEDRIDAYERGAIEALTTEEFFRPSRLWP